MLYHSGAATLQGLRYFAAVAEHQHFGRAAKACHVSQPTLSSQLRKLEGTLGVPLFERTNRRVSLTAAGERTLEHARKALEEVGLLEAAARGFGSQTDGPLRLGVIPTLAPYLMPLILAPLRDAHPKMPVELWEDVTDSLLAMVRGHSLDAALVATGTAGAGLTEVPLFDEQFLAALPPGHRLAGAARVSEAELSSGLLVLADGHCLAIQSLAACGRQAARRESFRAASLETLVNLVEANYGVTLVPELAAAALAARKIVLRPLQGGASRTIRLVSRSSFARPQALRALEETIRKATATRRGGKSFLYGQPRRRVRSERS